MVDSVCKVKQKFRIMYVNFRQKKFIGIDKKIA